MAKVGKAKIANTVSDMCGIDKKTVSRVFDAIFETIGDTLSNSEDTVTIMGFGTFSVKERAARKGINPQTKESIEIPACKTVRFSAGNELDSKVK